MGRSGFGVCGVTVSSGQPAAEHWMNTVLGQPHCCHVFLVFPLCCLLLWAALVWARWVKNRGWCGAALFPSAFSLFLSWSRFPCFASLVHMYTFCFVVFKKIYLMLVLFKKFFSLTCCLWWSFFFFFFNKSTYIQLSLPVKSFDTPCHAVSFHLKDLCSQQR